MHVDFARFFQGPKSGAHTISFQHGGSAAWAVLAGDVSLLRYPKNDTDIAKPMKILPLAEIALISLHADVYLGAGG